MISADGHRIESANVVVDEVLGHVAHHAQAEIGRKDAGVLALIFLEYVGLHRAAHVTDGVASKLCVLRVVRFFVVFFICIMAMGIFGLGHGLYKYGGIGMQDYSSMNGYGHFLKPFLIFKAYWLAFAMVLFVLAIIMSNRGKDTTLLQRWKVSRKRLTPGLRKVALSSGVIFLALGSILSCPIGVKLISILPSSRMGLI